MRLAHTAGAGPSHATCSSLSRGSTPPPGNTTASGTNAMVAARRSMNTSRGSRTSITVAAKRGVAGGAPSARNAA